MTEQPPWTGVVADDLTGAADTAVHFASPAAPAVLLLEPERWRRQRTPRAAALALSTDARAASPRLAREASGAAAKALLAAGVERLYIKVDSTLRGEVAAHVAGALDVWRRERPDALALLCPAHALLGRTVSGGRLFVEGVAAHETPLGADPVSPVTTAAVAKLVPGCRPVRLPRSGTPAERAQALAARLLGTVQAHPAASILAVDAATETDLDVVAAAVVALAGRALPAGSAGLARALAPTWRPGRADAEAADRPRAAASPGKTAAPAGTASVLVLITSQHPATRRQLGVLRQRSDAARRLDIDVPPGELLDEVGYQRRGDTVAAVDDVPELVVLSLAPARVSVDAAAAPMLVDRLAGLAGLLHGRRGLAGAVVSGGDGARALATRLGATAIHLVDEVAPGLPRGVLADGPASGLQMVTKAGGFGAPDSLVEAAAAVARHAEIRDDIGGFTP